MIEKVLYATKIGDPDLAAQIITTDPDQFEPASARGFTAPPVSKSEFNQEETQT